MVYPSYPPNLHNPLPITISHSPLTLPVCFYSSSPFKRDSSFRLALHTLFLSISFSLPTDFPHIPFWSSFSLLMFHPITFISHIICIPPPFLCPLSTSMDSTEMQEKRLEKKLEFVSERECISSLYHPTPNTLLQLYPLPCQLHSWLIFQSVHVPHGLVHSSVDGRLDQFHSLATVTSAEKNTAANVCRGV